MIRSNCSFQLEDKRCGKVTRARRHHKFCRTHTQTVTNKRREIPHQIKKARIIKAKPIKTLPEPKGKKKKG